MPPITTKSEESQQQQAAAAALAAQENGSGDKPTSPTTPSSTTASVLKDRRFKLSRACDRCRRRRIKCDEGHPCQSCLTSNSACTFEEPGKRTHPHKSKRAPTLEDRMRHLGSTHTGYPSGLIRCRHELHFKVPQGSVASPQVPSSSAQASFAQSTHTYPSGVPPPSLNNFPLMNPSTFFGPSNPAPSSRHSSPQGSFPHHPPASRLTGSTSISDQLPDETSRMSGKSLSLLRRRRRHKVATTKQDPDGPVANAQRQSWLANEQQQQQQQQQQQASDWFPDRTARRTDINPEVIWKLVTSFIAPDLMDSLVQCYLSTSYYLMPFLHVPSFLADYGNPRKWGEPGFAAFIVAICCLASRHIDDPRVRADPSDGNTAGTVWFDLFTRLRSLPNADRPTIYTVQSVLIAGVYAVGLGKLSKAFALISEAITLSLDAGMHRSADAYDVFDAIEDEVRKRTFWCVYLWDKQAAVHFGRPPMIRLRDCDVGEPAIVDDEYITRDGIIGPQQPDGGIVENSESRMAAFVCCVRFFVVMEAILDVPPSRHFGDGSPFLTRATTILTGFRRHKELREEEALLDEILRSIPPHWAHSVETMTSDDVIRVTQAERLHCLEQFIRMLIQRHRFSEMVAEKAYSGANYEEQGEAECEAMRVAHSCALQIVSSHLQIAAKGLMTYYGVHVIHQLTAAGRTLVAVLLNCHSESLRPLIAPALEALRSCVGLLRRFSGRYVCGQRSGDLMEEFCRITQIPLESSRQDAPQNRSRPPWIRPVRKKTPSVAHSSASNDSPSHQSSPEAFSPSDAFLDLSGGVGAVSSSPSTAHPRSGSFSGPANGFNVLGGSPQPPPAAFSMPPPSADGNVDMLSPTGTGPGGGLSNDLLAMFNDGSVDVAALLMSPELASPNGMDAASDFYASLTGASGMAGLDGNHPLGMVSP
ncbi:hypothetical protein K474DRAFT_1679582 [Panus rudis PR-1116 ss-1]|nr:hypothetical protein K474DRAFT_1679582 [Panus rudis PR-1116 ss-1]